jgi:hypothetical protein
MDFINYENYCTHTHIECGTHACRMGPTFNVYVCTMCVQISLAINYRLDFNSTKNNWN